MHGLLFVHTKGNEDEWNDIARGASPAAQQASLAPHFLPSFSLLSSPIFNPLHSSTEVCKDCVLIDQCLSIIMQRFIGKNRLCESSDWKLLR